MMDETSGGPGSWLVLHEDVASYDLAGFFDLADFCDLNGPGHFENSAEGFVCSRPKGHHASDSITAGHDAATGPDVTTGPDLVAIIRREMLFHGLGGMSLRPLDAYLEAHRLPTDGRGVDIDRLCMMEIESECSTSDAVRRLVAGLPSRPLLARSAAERTSARLTVNNPGLKSEAS